MKERKRHFFKDCLGFTMYGDKSKTIFADEVRDTTCGACKQRILKVYLEADWTKLNDRAIDVLRDAALLAYGLRQQLPIW